VKVAIKMISRRDFLERSLKLAGLTGFGRPWLRGLTCVRFPEGAPAGPLPDPGPESGSEPFFGVQTHFGQHRPDAEGLLDLIKGAGVGWIRDEVYWSEIEKEKGVFKFPPAHDTYLRAARARGIQVLLILDFGNSLYSGSEKHAPATEGERLAFARYCREIVKQCAPLGVRHYEVWNEPNASTFWRPRPNPEDYAKLLETAFRACKEADPGATVLDVRRRA
jgi:hypothetical protein